jgi:hypothetical protein
MFRSYQARNLGRRVVHIPRDNRLHRANDYAGGLKLSFDSVSAVVTLFGGVSVRVDVERVIRAGLHTRFAADAAVAVEINYPITALEQGGHRADSYTRRVLAVIASEDGKESSRVRVFAFFYVLHPGAKCAERDFVFGFTRDRACVAADAFAVINYEPVFHFKLVARRASPQLASSLGFLVFELSKD